MDWGTVLSLAGLFVIGFGYLSRQMHRLDDRQSDRMDRLEGRTNRLDDGLAKHLDRLEAKIDKLTERYITHLEQHPR